jgi:uncharacterized damage-inducible protein DinB
MMSTMTDTRGFSVVASTHIRYHRWATGRMLELVRVLTPEQVQQDLKTSYRSLYAMLGHMYQADATWWARLKGDVEHSQLSSNPIPETLLALEQAWSPMLGNLADWVVAGQNWEKDICYSNTTGNEFRTPTWQVILHLVNHAAQHRGQVTGMIRQLGGTPQNTDLITYYRLGCPD